MRPCRGRLLAIAMAAVAACLLFRRSERMTPQDAAPAIVGGTVVDPVRYVTVRRE